MCIFQKDLASRNPSPGRTERVTGKVGIILFSLGIILNPKFILGEKPYLHPHTEDTLALSFWRPKGIFVMELYTSEKDSLLLKKSKCNFHYRDTNTELKIILPGWAQLLMLGIPALGRLRWEDHLRPRVQDQPGQHNQTPSLLKIQN